MILLSIFQINIVDQILVTHTIEYLKLFKSVLYETRNLLSTKA